MKYIYFLAILVGWMLAGTVSAEHLRKKATLFRGNFGYGWLSGGNVRETEEDIADGVGMVTRIPLPGGGYREETVQYAFGGVQGNLEATYLVDSFWGFGGYFRYRGINQMLETTLETGSSSAASFMTLNCFGPQLLLYKPTVNGVDFIATAVLGVARGSVRRIAFIDKYIDDPLNDEVYAWYSEPLATAGMHFGMEGAVLKCWFNGFCADVSLRYDMYYLTFAQERNELVVIGRGTFTYPEHSVHNSIGIGIGVGFASHVQKSMPQ